MTVLPFNLALLNDTNGITCFENLFIAVLKQNNVPYQALFIHSFISIEKIISVFLNEKIKYAYFDRIQRLQYLASSLKVADIVDYPVDYTHMVECLRKQLNIGMPLIIGVDPKKLPKHGEILPWREEHYILLYGLDRNQVMALDDIPKRALKMSEDIVREAYINKSSHIIIKEDINKNLYYCEVVDVIHEMTKEYAVSFDSIDRLIALPIEDIIYIRDAIGILRVLRRRTKVWLEWITDKFIQEEEIHKVIKCLDETIEILDKFYSIIEFYRLRNKVNYSTMKDCLKDAINQESIWLDKLNSMNV